MTPITIKDSANVDCVFAIIRQPGGSLSGILLTPVSGAGMNRTAYPKVEVSSRIVKGRAEPTVTVSVPFGSTITGNFVPEGQVTHVHGAKLPPNAPDKARMDAEAFARNLLANAQVQALLQNGVVS